MKKKEFTNLHSLLDRCDLISTLGEGGMSVIKLYRDRQTHTIYAVKMLTPDRSMSMEAVDRFFHEIKASARLDHPNIIRLVSYGSYDDQYCLVMEYISGGSLKLQMENRTSLTPETSLFIITEILRGIHYAHQEGIIHRDLKPSNVLLDSSGYIKVTDFGVSKVSDMTRLTHSGSLLGTPAYMAPEQAVGEAADRRSDLFSVGLILYEIVSGVNPYLANYPSGTLMNILHKPYTSILQHNPGLPQFLDDMLFKSLKKNPDERFQTAEEMLDAAKKLLKKYDDSYDRKKFQRFLEDPYSIEISLKEKRVRHYLSRAASLLKHKKSKSAEAVLFLYRAHCLLPQNKRIKEKLAKYSRAAQFYPNLMGSAELRNLEKKLKENPADLKVIKCLIDASKKNRDPYRYLLYSRQADFFGGKLKKSGNQGLTPSTEKRKKEKKSSESDLRDHVLMNIKNKKLPKGAEKLKNRIPLYKVSEKKNRFPRTLKIGLLVVAVIVVIAVLLNFGEFVEDTSRELLKDTKIKADRADFIETASNENKFSNEEFQTIYKSGLRYEVERKWEKAADSFEKLKSLPADHPMRPEILYRLGNAYLQMGEIWPLEEAIDELGFIAPDSFYHTKCLIAHALELSRQEKFEKALWSYDKGYESIDNLTNKKDLAEFYFNFGLALEETKRYSQAAALYKSYLERQPEKENELRARLHLGEAYEHLSRFNDAIEQYEIILEKATPASLYLRLVKERYVNGRLIKPEEGA